MISEDMKRGIRKLVSEITGAKNNKLKDDSRFAEDLGVDSMMALEIVASIEKKFRIAIPEKNISKIKSIQDVYTIMSKLSK